MSQPLKFYYDFMSQPSRALFIIMNLSNTPFTSVPIALGKRKHLTDEYKRINRFQKVPCIDDDGFKLSESIAILRYLDDTERISSKLYPSTPAIRSRVDEYLEWQHENTRLACALYFRDKFLMPLINGEEPEPERISFLTERMDNTLNMIENIWLRENKYIAANTLTVADVFAACEIEQPRMCGYEPTKNRPAMKEWLLKVQNECSPIYDLAHRHVYLIANSNFSKAKIYLYKLYAKYKTLLPINKN